MQENFSWTDNLYEFFTEMFRRCSGSLRQRLNEFNVTQR